MELSFVIRLLRKWLWLIVLAGVVAGGINFLLRSNQPPLYRATVMLSIGDITQMTNPTQIDIALGERLAETYVQILRTFPVLDGTIQALSLPITAESLRTRIGSNTVDGTTLFNLWVNYPDNTLVAEIANELARQLILNSPTRLDEAQIQTLNIANEQVTRLREQQNQVTTQYATINARLTDPGISLSDAERQSLTAERDALLQQLNTIQTNITNTNATIADIGRQRNRIEIVEPARTPSASFTGPPTAAIPQGALVGVALALALAFFIEYMDDTVRNSEQAAQLLGLPILGAIARFGKPKESHKEKLITRQSLISPVPEGYRVVRTNLLLTTHEDEKSVFIITSPGPEEGKSLTTANLAVSMAWAGMNVLLVDADLRRPKVHEVFGLDNDIGLTTLLSIPVNSNGNGAMRDELRERLKQCIKETDIPKLRVITSGFPPRNPSEILGSGLMKLWVDAFRNSDDFDVVLIDTPPCMVVSDSLALASSTGADVVMVVQARGTRRAAAIKAKEQFTQIGTDIKGVIVNAIDPRDESGYYYTEYTYYSDERQPKRGLARLFSRRSAVTP